MIAMKKKIGLGVIIIFCIFALSTLLLAEISGRDFTLINYLLSVSGGDKLSTASKSQIVSVGQTVAAKSESSKYTVRFGYIPQIIVIYKRQEENLDKAYVYPNPYKPLSGGRFDAEYLTFSKLTRTAKIEIFNIAGERVAEINKDSDENYYEWDARNNHGRKLGSGVYIFYISNEQGHKKVGKFSIIR